MCALQRSFGFTVADHLIRGLHLKSVGRFVFFRQVIQNISHLMHLATLNERGLASDSLDRGTEGFAAID